MKYQFNLEVINNETGEIINLSELCNGINMVDNDELSQRMAVSKQMFIDVGNIYRVIEYNFINSMREMEAKKYVGEDYVITLKEQVDYNYDTKKVNRIKQLISEEEFNDIFTEYYKVNRTKLKSIIALGGEIKQLSESMQEKIVRKPTITLTTK